MQDPNSFPSFQPERGDSLAEELYPDIFSDTFPPIEPGPATSSELYSIRNVQRRTTRTEKRAVRTKRSTSRVGAMRDDPTPISLVGALQATIARKQPKKGPLVISGEKKRQRNTDRVYRVRPVPTRQLAPQLRLVILFVVIVLILLAILLFPMTLSMSRVAFPSRLVMIG